MIIEFIQYLFESTSKHARSFGHLHESIAILKRQKRNQQAWKEHQDNCKNEIINFCQNVNPKNSILVLGSGLLHEIPIEYLQKNFKKVTLVDIVHLNFVKKYTKKYSNIELIEHDISEVEKDLTKGNFVNRIPTRFINEEFSVVISANLMSQIPLNLKKYIDRSKLHEDEKYIDRFCQSAYENHYKYLKNFECPTLLITDIETNLVDIQNNIIESDSPSLAHILPKAHKEWIWNIAPKGEIDRELSLQMKVASIIIK